MLDRIICAQLLSQHTGKQQSLFVQQLQAAQAVWLHLIQDSELQENLRKEQILSFSIPLATVYSAQSSISNYGVCGIDGSQIYPDKHEGFSEYLINIGTAQFTYVAPSSCRLHTQPFIFSGCQHGLMVTPEYVNAQRTAYELARALEIIKKDPQTCIMFDGALLFWHLQTPAIQELFLTDYLASLSQISALSGLYLGYISGSHSRELIMLIQAASKILGKEQIFDYLVDTDIMEHFLQPGHYTQLFKTHSVLAKLYPAHLEPCFIYLHVGSEIARVEVPVYCSAPEKLDYMVRIILDQIKKGNGYPVALSEAHEQAVVKAADREFFYTMLQLQHKTSPSLSLKLSKKRSAAI